MEGADAGADAAAGGDAGAGDDEAAAPELEPVELYDCSGRRRRRGGRDRRDDARTRPDEQRPREAPRAGAHASGGGVQKPVTSLDTLLGATAALLKPAKKAPFLGTGAFGGPWSVSRD